MVGCSKAEQDTSEQDISKSDEKAVETSKQQSEGWNVETVATDLDEPWEIVKAGESLYISERIGNIVEVTEGNFERKPVELEEPLAGQSEAGLLGIAFPNTFDEKGKAFAYYSYSNADMVFQRIVTIEEQANKWVETGVLLDKIPGGQFHQGGRIEIGPDGKIYATTGDATEPKLAQDKHSLAGKVLRLNLDGSVPVDNPFANSFVYTYGHRNPQGLAWDGEGRLYATEHGDQTHDEINLLEPGKNYGWPEIEANETKNGMVEPLIYSGDNTWAPSGMAFYRGEFYFASLRGQALRHFNREKETQKIVVEGYGRIRDVLSADNGMYVITNNTDGRGNPDEKDDRLLFLSED